MVIIDLGYEYILITWLLFYFQFTLHKMLCGFVSEFILFKRHLSSFKWALFSAYSYIVFNLVVQFNCVYVWCIRLHSNWKEGMQITYLSSCLKNLWFVNLNCDVGAVNEAFVRWFGVYILCFILIIDWMGPIAQLKQDAG